MRSLIIFLLPLCFSVRAASVVSIISLDPLPAFRGSITLDSQGNWLAIATDGVLKKIAPDGRTVIFMRNFAAGSTVATSPAGDIYVVGMSDTITASSGSFQTTGGPGFLMKLNSSGEPLFTARINATPRAVAVGPSGDVFVAGKADEGFITTELAFQRLHSRFPKTDCTNPLGGLFFPMFCGDAFVMRVSPDGTQLRYATYLGGTYQEDVSGMKVDAFGNAYVVGITLSENFPVTTNAFDTTFGGRQRISIGTAVGDGFAAKLDPQGQHLEWSTYVGGSDGGEAFLVIELAGEDEVYVTGGTASSDFPATPGAFRAEYAGLFSGAFTTGDTFLVKLGPQGAGQFATYLGGFGAPQNIVAASGRVYFNAPGDPSVYGDRLPSPCFAAGRGMVEFDGTTGRPLAFMYAPWVGVPLADAAGRVMTIGWPNGIGLNQPTNRPFAAVLDFSRDDTVRTDCLVNGASFEDLRVTPDSWTRVAYGEIITIFGRGLGPAVGLVGKLDATGTLPVELGGTSLSMSGVALPLLYVSDGQVNAIVPFQIPGGSAGSKTIRLTAGGVNLEVGVEVSRSPAFFFLGSTNFAAAIGEDGRVITRANPARPGEIVALFGTGFGLFSQNVPDGKVISLAPPWPTLEQFADLRYGDPPVKRLEILYAGPAPGLIAGVVQINARIPADAAGPLTIRTPDGSPIELPIQ